MVPEHRHAVLDPARAVGDLREIAAAHRLLRRAEAAMIGRRGLQIARLQPAPEMLLVLLRPERRAHDIGRGGRPIGMAVDAVIDEEVPGEDLAIDALPLVARPCDRLERFPAAIVDDINRDVEHLGDADGAVRRLALDLGRARQRVAFRPGDAGLQELLLEAEDELAILGMDGADGAELARPGEAVHQHLVIRHDGVLIGHEMLEAVDAALAGQHPHLVMDPLAPPRHGDVEGIIGAGFLGPAAPHVIGREQRLLRARDDEVDDHRRAAGERRRRAALEILARHRAHKGQLHMGMRIDATRHDILPAGIDHPRPGRRREILADRRDHPVGAIDVAAETMLGCDDGAATDQQGHVVASSFWGRWPLADARRLPTAWSNRGQLTRAIPA